MSADQIKKRIKTGKRITEEFKENKRLHRGGVFLYLGLSKSWTQYLSSIRFRQKNYKDFLEKLQQKYPEANFMISKSIEDTHRFIDENFASTEVFVAVGGDGTISTVAQKLINTDKILAVFPAGSGNGFSNETNFTKNIDSLLQKIKQKKFHKIDTFTVNGNLSINVSGTGFDGEVIKNSKKQVVVLPITLRLL